MKKYLKNLNFISICFLVSLAEVVILYSFPIILYNGYKNIIFVGLILALKPLFQCLGILLLRRVKDKIKIYLLFLVGFSLFFILVILFNKIDNILILPVILLLLGLATGLFEIGKMAFIKEKLAIAWSSDLFRVVSVVNILSFVIAPLFTTGLIINEDYNGVFSFFAVLIAVSGIIFYFGLRRIEKTLPSIYAQIHEKTLFTFDVFYIEIIKAGVMLIVPLYVINFFPQDNNLIFAIPIFFIPSLIIRIFFRVFKVNFRNINGIIRNLALCMALFLFFFNQSNGFFLVAIAILGFVVALIENEAKYQENIKNRYLSYYYSISVVGIVGVVLMGFLSYFYNINLSFSIIGVLILVLEIIISIRKLFLQRKNISK